MTSLIRMAQQSDCAELAKVHVASWQAGFKGIIDQDYLDKLDVDARALGWSKLLSGERDKVYLQFDSESLIGFTSSCHCRDDDAQVTRGEIVTFYFLEQYWGKGFSTEAVHRIVKAAFSGDLSCGKLNRIQGDTVLGNSASESLLLKVGFKEEGIRRQSGYWKNQFHDLKCFGLIQSEYSEIRQVRIITNS